jgi:hypothetical protein
MEQEINALIKYNVSDAIITEMRQQMMPLTVTGPEDKVGAEMIHNQRMIVKLHRVDVEKTRKALKADALEFGRKVDNEAKRLTTALEEIENHLLTQEEIVTKHQARLAAERKAKEDAEKAKIEAERQAQIAADEAAIRQHQEKIRQQQERLAAEQLKIEQEKLRQAQEQARIEQEKARIAQAKVDAEKRAIEAEKRRLEQEQEARLAEEKRQLENLARLKALEAAKPDVEKTLLYCEQILSVETPEITDSACFTAIEKILSVVLEQQTKLKQHCNIKQMEA